MNLVLVASIVIRVVALVWSLVLLRRLRDWRMGFLSAMLALMALRQSLTLARSAELKVASVTGQATELPGLAVSVLALLAVLFLERIITEHRAKDEALHRSEQQLRQSQKMEAIGRLAGGVAHDFNNLLTAILGYAESLLRHLPGNGEAQLAAAEIYRAGERAAELTHQLLAFSRKQTLRPRLLDLNESVTGLRNMLSRLIGEDVALSIRPDGKPAPVYADAAQLEQVILNLAVNAREAMPSGGALEIAVDTLELADRALAEVPGELRGPFVRMSVRDTGRGMDERLQQRIFEPFFTTKDASKGTGLGLSTVFGIVEQSGGFVRVRSAPGEGSTFEVFLPRAEMPSRSADAVPARPGRDEGAQRVRSVLLVEDEPAVRNLAASVLLSAGHSVLTAADGTEALEVATRHRGAIDVLLTDVVMPGMSGIELARQLGRSRPHIAVVFMSGYVRGSDSGSLDLPPQAVFVAKPFTVRDLLDVVERAIEIAETRSPRGQ